MLHSESLCVEGDCCVYIFASQDNVVESFYGERHFRRDVSQGRMNAILEYVWSCQSCTRNTKYAIAGL